MRSLTDEEMRDFRIPIEIFNRNVRVMHNTSPALRTRILQAIGIDCDSKDCRIDWEQFLQLNKLLQPQVQDREEVIRFAVRLFNPQESSFVQAHLFEELIKEIFSPGNAASEPENDFLKDDLIEITLDKCQQAGVYSPGGYLNSDKLHQAF